MVPPTAVLQRYTFQSSSALMVVAKSGQFANVPELYETLRRFGGRIQHVDETHLTKGKLLVYF